MRGSLSPFLLLVLGACAKRQEPPPLPQGTSGSPEPALVSLSTDRSPEPARTESGAAALPGAAPAVAAQGVFDRHCGECHRSDRATAKPGALAVFDLTRDGWLAGMTPSQLEAAGGRIKGNSAIGDDERRAALSALGQAAGR